MYPTLLTYSSRHVTPEQRRAHTENQGDEDITGQLMRERFALGFFMQFPHAPNKALDEMRKGVTDYLVKNPSFVSLYHQLRLIAEPKLSLGDSLVFLAARPHSAELNKKLAPPSLDLTPTPDTVVVVPLTVWPFRNFGSWHLPSDPAPLTTGPQAPIAVSQSDLQLSCGRWLDATMCAVCKSSDNLLYCGFHQIVLCGKCFNHDACHSVLECGVQVDDFEAGAQQVEDYKDALEFLSFLQLLGPTLNLASALAQVWGLEEQVVTRSSRRQAPETTSPTLVLRCAVAGPDCEENATFFCSSCSQMACNSCSGDHGPEECKLFDMPAIRKLWYSVTERLSPPEEALQILANIPQGQHIAERVSVETNKIPEVMLKQISLLTALRFTKACRHVEKECLSKPAAPAPATATLAQARVRTARRLMREWELASTDEQRRAAVVAQAKIFLKSEERAEEKAEEAKQVPEGNQAEANQAEAELQERDIGAEDEDPSADAKLSAEYERLTRVLKNSKTCRLENTRWQAVDPSAVVAPHPTKACKLIWLDPFYQEEHQPLPSETSRMREIVDALSQEGTVVLIFGRPYLLYSRWAPIFEDGVNKSKLRWAVDPSLFFVHRQRQRDCKNSNFKVWHSMTEAILTVVRKQKSDKKFLIPDTRMYNPEFKQKYGDINGVPTNVFSNYLPPKSGPRLRNDDGEKLRTNAEKTPLICEYFLDLLTKEGDLVADLYAGTASMGLACLKSKRCYYGSEVDEEVFSAASHRLARLIEVLGKPSFTKFLLETPGLDDGIASQVSTQYTDQQ